MVSTQHRKHKFNSNMIMITVSNWRTMFDNSDYIIVVGQYDVKQVGTTRRKVNQLTITLVIAKSKTSLFIQSF